MRSTPSLLTIRRTVNVSLMPAPLRMITVPEKTCTRSLSPSTMRVATSTVSPTWNFGGSFFRWACSTPLRMLFVMILSPIFCFFAMHASGGRLVLSVQPRLPQVGPSVPRPRLPLLQSPLRDQRVVAAQQHVRHAHAAIFARLGVLRILQQAVGERLVRRSRRRAECAGEES